MQGIHLCASAFWELNGLSHFSTLSVFPRRWPLWGENAKNMESCEY